MRSKLILILSRYFVKRLVGKNVCLNECRSKLVSDDGSTIVYRKVQCCPKFLSFLGIKLHLNELI